MPTTVPCPTCNRPVEWTDASPWRPFCSERCKLIDLGAWASGQRSIAGEEIKEDGDEDSDAC
ncbi:MAG TPA: DNA gyrase inhibitor YacG [Steroidobacteraceae bacterium]|nr:DNA gyrase inhibitor YacG [Steroidobacteraceae bacterium]